MEKITHFNLPENTNTLYENEAISSISLTRDVANKINEIIDTLNDFSKIDLEWKQEQEGIIRKGVVYMRDHLMNNLDDLTTSLKNSGFFDKRLEELTKVLSGRVDNLVTGGTPSGSEVIDARVDGNGLTHATLGNAIRYQFSKNFGVKDVLDNNTDLNTLEHSGYYYISGSNTYLNLPENNQGGMLLVYHRNEFQSYQIYLSYTSNKIYWRNRLSSNTFKEWNRLGWSDFSLTDGDDLNNISTTGTYFIPYDVNILNLPETNNGGMLQVYHQSDYRSYQIYFSYNTESIYWRNRIDGNTFSNWRKIGVSVLTGEIQSSPYMVRKISDNEFHIYRVCSSGMIRYKYHKNVNASINLDTWQLGTIFYCDKAGNPIKMISSDGYDNEGVLKIDGEADYVGGIHGDEKFTDLAIFINGKQYTPANIPNTYADEIRIVVKSNITHADTSNVCMTKIKQTTFDANGIHINNRWKLLEDLVIDRVYGSLLSIDKTCVNKYYDSKINTFPVDIPASNGSWLDNNIVDTYYMGDISAHIWCGVRGGDESMYRTEIYDYDSRMKSYFGCYYGYSGKTGDELYAENNFNITC